MSKFGRNYRAIIDSHEFIPGTRKYKEVVIEPPITVEFTVDRATLSSANVSLVRFYNLSKKTRESIEKDRWIFGVDRRFSLFAGYGNDISRIALGNLQQVRSYREGTDIITEVSSFDGGWILQQAKSNFSVPRGTKKQDIVSKLIEDLKRIGRVPVGAIGSFPGEISRAQQFTGNTFRLLKEFTESKVFIDNGFVFVLQDREAVNSDIIIDSDTGLLGTPYKEQVYINFTMVLEPKLHLQQIITLNSRTGVDVNGKHVIYSISHHGTISPSVTGEMTSTVGFFNDNLAIGVDRGVAGQ